MMSGWSLNTISFIFSDSHPLRIRQSRDIVPEDVDPSIVDHQLTYLRVDIALK
jgi:hypothetical protein